MCQNVLRYQSQMLFGDRPNQFCICHIENMVRPQSPAAVFIEYLPTWSILTVAGHVTGPGISASRWLNCVLAILHCWRPICTASDVETEPLVHIAMVLTRWQNIWCYNAQHATRRGGSHGQISTIKATLEARRLWSFLERIGAVTRPPDRE